MSDTSYNLTMNTEVKGDKQVVNVPVYRYLDIDSTYRNRNNYPNPNNFVIPITYPGRDSTAATSIDPVIDAIPYTGSSNSPGTNVTQVSTDALNITLDADEININNYYINSILEMTIGVTQEFSTITNYDGTTFIATVSPAFSSTPPAGTVYYIRKSRPFFIGTVAASPAPTSNQLTLDSAASSISNIYTNSYIRFTSGSNFNQVYRISSYNGGTKVLTLSSNMVNIPTAGDTIELDSFSRDNASTLFYSGSSTSSQTSYYEIELLWLTVPNVILGMSYGGSLDNYPYIYLHLYNEGRRLANQVMFSNNPNSTLVLFKIPINEYFGDTSFLTLKDAKTKQVIRFEPNSDLRFTLTVPDGSIINFSQTDTLSPLSPNPFLQVNALFSLRKVG